MHCTTVTSAPDCYKAPTGVLLTTVHYIYEFLTFHSVLLHRHIKCTNHARHRRVTQLSQRKSTMQWNQTPVTLFTSFLYLHPYWKRKVG